MLHRFRGIAVNRSEIAIFGYPSCVNSPGGGVPLGRSPWNFQRMSTDGPGIKCHTSIAENFNRLSRVHDRYRQTTYTRQTTHGRATAYSERSLKIGQCLFKLQLKWRRYFFETHCISPLHSMYLVVEWWDEEYCFNCPHHSDHTVFNKL